MSSHGIQGNEWARGPIRRGGALQHASPPPVVPKQENEGLFSTKTSALADVSHGLDGGAFLQQAANIPPFALPEVSIKDLEQQVQNLSKQLEKEMRDLGKQTLKLVADAFRGKDTSAVAERVTALGAQIEQDTRALADLTAQLSLLKGS